MKLSILIFLLIYSSNVFCQLCGELEWINMNNNIYGTINSISIQQDGKIVAVGTKYFGSSFSYFAVSRYDIYGNLDTSFSSDGMQITNINNHGDGKSSAIQSDGKIIVGGIEKYGSFGNLTLIRYNSNGSIDSTFSTNGIATFNIDSTSNFGGYIALQPDGKILISGDTYSINSNINIVRYNTDGSLDSTFSTDGIVTTDINGHSDKVYCIAVQQDGKIIVAGSSNDDIALIRYNTDGSIDSSFSADGIIITDINNSIDIAKAIVIQNDGKILLTGTSDNNFVLIRYNSDGSFDSTFSINGIFSMLSTISITPNALAIQLDGKIIVAGSHLNGSMKDFAFVRFNVNGTLDSSLYNNGIVTTPLTWSSGARCIAIQQDHKIILGGDSWSDVNYFTLTRYTCEDVSIETINSKIDIIIFPNPTKESLTIKLKDSNFSPTMVTIYNYQGKLQKSLILDNNESTIDLHELFSGIYEIQVVGEKINYSDKFIKIY